MQPLLRIQNVPINIEYATTRASLQHNTDLPRVNVSRQKGRSDIQTRPAKVKLDGYEMRASMGVKTTPRVIQEAAQTGKQASMEATRTYAEEGNQMVDTHQKNVIAEIAASKSLNTVDTIMAFIPSEPIDISVDPASIQFDYTMDKLTFDWNVNPRPQLEYLPGSIEFSVTQYPQVIIEYIGSPIYVPPSADPSYVPTEGELNATA